MLKSISKKKVVVINLISIVIGLIGYAYFLKLSHNTDFKDNFFVIIFVLLSFFDSMFAVAGFRSIFQLEQQDNYQTEDPTYQLTVLTIVMSVIVIVAAIIFKLFII